MKLEILFKDVSLIAVDKPAGQLVHPSSTPEPEDEVTMKILRDQIGRKVHVLHRIDRPTCGVLLFALDDDSGRVLRKAFRRREVEKTYLAVVDGIPERDSWICRKPLRRDPESGLRDAETSFRVLETSAEGISLVEAKPRTGRYHQIRRHLQFAGTPILGDYRYAGIERSDLLGTRLGTGTRMLLQAKRLAFRHPRTGSRVEIEAPAEPLMRCFFRL